MLCAEEVKRHVALGADDPAIVRSGWNVEQVPRSELHQGAILERRHRTTRDDESHVLYRTQGCAGNGRNVNRPLPARLIRGAANCEPADVNDLETAVLKNASLVGFFEPLEDDGEHFVSPLFLNA